MTQNYTKTCHMQLSFFTMQTASTVTGFRKHHGRSTPSLIPRIAFIPNIHLYRDHRIVRASSIDEGRFGSPCVLSSLVFFEDTIDIHIGFTNIIFPESNIWGERSLPDVSEGAFAWLEEQGMCVPRFWWFSFGYLRPTD